MNILLTQSRLQLVLTSVLVILLGVLIYSYISLGMHRAKELADVQTVPVVIIGDDAEAKRLAVITKALEAAGPGTTTPDQLEKIYTALLATSSVNKLSDAEMSKIYENLKARH